MKIDKFENSQPLSFSPCADKSSNSSSSSSSSSSSRYIGSNSTGDSNNSDRDCDSSSNSNDSSNSRCSGGGGSGSGSGNGNGGSKGRRRSRGNSSLQEENLNFKAPQHLLALCEGNPSVAGGFPSQRASNVDSGPMPCCHNVHVLPSSPSNLSITQSCVHAQYQSLSDQGAIVNHRKVRHANLMKVSDCARHYL